jgi:hypothetical protein
MQYSYLTYQQRGPGISTKEKKNPRKEPLDEPDPSIDLFEIGQTCAIRVCTIIFICFQTFEIKQTFSRCDVCSMVFQCSCVNQVMLSYTYQLEARSPRFQLTTGDYVV